MRSLLAICLIAFLRIQFIESYGFGRKYSNRFYDIPIKMPRTKNVEKTVMDIIRSWFPTTPKTITTQKPSAIITEAPLTFGPATESEAVAPTLPISETPPNIESSSTTETFEIETSNTTDYKTTTDLPITTFDPEATTDLPIATTDPEDTSDLPITTITTDIETTTDLPITTTETDAATDVEITKPDPEASTDLPINTTDTNNATEFLGSPDATDLPITQIDPEDVSDPENPEEDLVAATGLPITSTDLPISTTNSEIEDPEDTTDLPMTTTDPEVTSNLPMTTIDFDLPAQPAEEIKKGPKGKQIYPIQELSISSKSTLLETGERAYAYEAIFRIITDSKLKVSQEDALKFLQELVKELKCKILNKC